MQRFTLKCFGVGDGLPCTDRNHAAFLYRLGKTSILIDCGEPIDGSYKASGLGYDLIDSVFLSHLHSDHAGGFFMLMQGFWLEGRKKPLPVYLPAYGVKPVREMLRAVLLFPSLLPFRLQLLPLRTSKPILVNGVKVTAFPTSHLGRLKAKFRKSSPRNFTSYCFLIESWNRRMVHSSDLGRPEDLEPLLRQPLDLLVCELAHFSARDIFGYLQGRPIKRVVFVHLGRDLWQNLAVTRGLAARMLPGIPHTFACDLDEIPF